jgi:transposase
MEAEYHRHDISEEAWKKLEPHLLGQRGQWGGIAENNRRFINAVFWILRTGAPWRDLPPDYGKWKTVHTRFIRWRNGGFWEELLYIIIGLEGSEFEWLMIDATHVKVHPHAAGAVGGNQDMERTKGGSIPRYTFPWLRMVCRSDVLSQRVPLLIVQKLWNYWKV